VSRFDCVCAGIVVADFLCAPAPRLPGAGELVLTDGISMAIGGCASNVAVDLSRLGRNVAVVGCIGPDASGRFVRETFETAGVDCTHLRVAEGWQTSATLVVNVKGEDRRFIHATGANGAFLGDQVAAELISATKVLYVGGFLMVPGLMGDTVGSWFRMAREAGVQTVLDVVVADACDGWKELQKVLPWTDVFLPNNDEAHLLTGLEDPCRQAERFASAGAKTVVVTCGSRGAVLLEKDRRLRSKTFVVDFVDGTGSGDAFAAGVIDGLLQNAPSERCLEIGSALGASCVRQPGATTGVFRRGELNEFLATHRLPIETW